MWGVKVRKSDSREVPGTPSLLFSSMSRRPQELRERKCVREEEEKTEETRRQRRRYLSI